MTISLKVARTAGIVIVPTGGPKSMYLSFSRAALTRKIRELSISEKKTGLEGCQIKRLVGILKQNFCQPGSMDGWQACVCV
jgi:hypothetical protein